MVDYKYKITLSMLDRDLKSPIPELDSIIIYYLNSSLTYLELENNTSYHTLSVDISIFKEFAKTLDKYLNHVDICEFSFDYISNYIHNHTDLAKTFNLRKIVYDRIS